MSLLFKPYLSLGVRFFSVATTVIKLCILRLCFGQVNRPCTEARHSGKT